MIKNYFLFTILLFSLLLTSFSGVLLASSRTDELVSIDTTERLENIAELKKNIKSLKLQIQTLNIALTEAKKHKSTKMLWTNTEKISDAITALTILVGALATYHFKNKARVLKIATFVGGLSSSLSVISGLVADLSTDDAEIITNKINEIMPILKATEINLTRETKHLCKLEPSNQMCR